MSLSEKKKKEDGEEATSRQKSGRQRSSKVEVCQRKVFETMLRPMVHGDLFSFVPSSPSPSLLLSLSLSVSVCLLVVLRLVLWCGVWSVWCVRVVVWCETLKKTVWIQKNASVCTFKTSQCMPAQRAHVLKHVRVVPVHTGTFSAYIWGRV